MQNIYTHIHTLGEVDEGEVIYLFFHDKTILLIYSN